MVTEENIKEKKKKNKRRIYVNFLICNFVNLEMVNYGIHLVNNLSTLLSLQISLIWRIKNEELEVVETSPNPSLLKKTSIQDN